MKTTITITALLFFSIILYGQEKIYIGSFRCYSSHGPLMYYWNNAQVNTQFRNDLDSLLNSRWQLTLEEKEQLFFSFMRATEFLGTNTNPIKKFPAISLDIVEYSPAALYKIMQPANTNDSAFFKDLLSGVRFIINIVDKDGKNIYAKELEVYLKKGESNGIGLPIANMSLTAKAFNEVLKFSLQVLLNKADSTQVIEMKSAGVFAIDNFLLPMLQDKPRIPIVSNNNFSRYAINTNQQILRWDKQLYREIILSGSKRSSVKDSLQMAIKKQRRDGSSIFLYLVQDLRDVVGNKTYRLEMPAQMSASNFNEYDQPTMPLVEFIQGNHHYLLENNDTIARFSLATAITDSTKRFQLNTTTNGIDIYSAVKISDEEKIMPMTYDFIVTGTLKNRSFVIKGGANRFIRELWLDDTFIAVVYGLNAPEKIVLLKENIDIPILNTLLLIGYNSFFQ